MMTIAVLAVLLAQSVHAVHLEEEGSVVLSGPLTRAQAERSGYATTKWSDFDSCPNCFSVKGQGLFSYNIYDRYGLSARDVSEFQTYKKGTSCACCSACGGNVPCPAQPAGWWSTEPPSAESQCGRRPTRPNWQGEDPEPTPELAGPQPGVLAPDKPAALKDMSAINSAILAARGEKNEELWRASQERKKEAIARSNEEYWKGRAREEERAVLAKQGRAIERGMQARLEYGKRLDAQIAEYEAARAQVKIDKYNENVVTFEDMSGKDYYTLESIPGHPVTIMQEKKAQQKKDEEERALQRQINEEAQQTAMEKIEQQDQALAEEELERKAAELADCEIAYAVQIQQMLQEVCPDVGDPDRSCELRSAYGDHRAYIKVPPEFLTTVFEALVSEDIQRATAYSLRTPPFEDIKQREGHRAMIKVWCRANR